MELKEGEVVRHYKGADYVIVGLAVHTETGERLVLYRSLDGGGLVWARPLSAFRGTVERGDYSGPRFRALTAKDVRSRD